MTLACGMTPACAMTRTITVVLAFAVQLWNQLGEAGCADPVSLSRIVSRNNKTSHRDGFSTSLAWYDPEIILPETNAPH